MFQNVSFPYILKVMSFGQRKQNSLKTHISQLLLFLIQTIQADYCQAPIPQYVPVPTGYKIRFVQTLVRHGDRTPFNSYFGDDAEYHCNATILSSIRANPSMDRAGETQRINVIDRQTNPFAKRYFWKGDCEVTQLTIEGIQQQHNLGKYQREKYLKMGLIPEYYDGKKIFIRSTERSRTLQSSQAFTQTFYPSYSRKNDEIINIYVLPLQVEFMFPNRILCDKIAIEEQNTYNIKEVAETRAKVKDIEEKFIRILGFRSKHPWLEDYVELMQCRRCHHFDFHVKMVNVSLKKILINYGIKHNLKIDIYTELMVWLNYNLVSSWKI